jgi:hypothetical protein
MSDPAFAKCACQHCGLHLEFPLEAAGAAIECPQCRRVTILQAAQEEEAPAEEEPGA